MLEKGLDFDLETGEVPRVLGDRELARRLLSQLVRQAAWRAPRASKLRLAVNERQGQIWIEVYDEGLPLMEGKSPYRFEKFFALSNDLIGTTGLELAVAKTIVDRMGGQMWVSSRQPQGNLFAVCFPSA